jgi:hypothetical protein
MKNWKKGPRRWLRFSLLMAPVKKLREVFVLHPVTEKKISRFLKFIFICPESASEEDMEQAKMGDFSKKLGKAVFFWEGGIPDPP